MEILVTLIVSFSLGILGAILVSRYGPRWRLLDIPGTRSSHAIPTPKGGGIGIPLAALVVTLLYTQDLLILTGFAILIAALALINDRLDLPVSVRFLANFALSVAFVKFLNPPIHSIFPEPQVLFPSLIIVLGSAFLLLAATNFFNFMDGINGIAGIEALISFSLLSIFALVFRESSQVPLFCLAIGAATAGFLLLNFPRAWVFMGDVGSTFLGFTYAALVLYLAQNPKEILLLFLFQAVFYIDCISTIFLRLKKGENIFQAHRKHLYQKLVHTLNWSHTKVTALFGTSQATLGILGLCLFNTSIFVIFLLWVAATLIYWGIMIALRLTKA